MVYDVIIIGAGPAGLTACLYALRFGLKTLLVDKAGVGGYLNFIDKLENFPGFPGYISGVELSQRINEQLKAYDFQFKPAEIKRIQFVDENCWELKSNNEVLKSKTVIIAVGRQPKKIGILGEEEFMGKGVSYCAMCDAPFFKNKDVVVIGGGNTALEEALYLSKFAKKVTIVHRRDKFRGDNIFQNKVKENKKIDTIMQTVCTKIEGQKKVESITLKDMQSNIRKFSTDGVFIFAGMRPLTGFVNGMLDMNESGYIKTEKNLAASAPGVFVAGDCRRDSLPQVISACGEGAKAAYFLHKLLAKYD